MREWLVDVFLCEVARMTIDYNATMGKYIEDVMAIYISIHIMRITALLKHILYLFINDGVPCYRNSLAPVFEVTRTYDHLCYTVIFASYST